MRASTSVISASGRRRCTLAIALHVLSVHGLNIHKFKCAQFKFTVYGRKQANKQISIHTHTRAQCSPASVGLTQARPNNYQDVPPK